MRKVRLSMLMDDIASHLIVCQKPVIGFIVEAMGNKLRARPISEINMMPYPYQGMVILPPSQIISEIPKTLKGLAEMVEILDTYLHIQMDITLAGYAYMLLNPFFSSRDITKDYIWADLDETSLEFTEITFTDKSKIAIRMRYEDVMKKLEKIIDLNVIEETCVCSEEYV